MTNQINEQNAQNKKEETCKSGSCGGGGCGMKAFSPCGIIKIAILAGLIIYAVNYFMK